MLTDLVTRRAHPSRTGFLAFVASFAAIAMLSLSGCDNASAEGRNAAAEQTEKAAAALESLSLMSVYPMTASRREDMRSRYGAFLTKYGSVPMGALTEQKAQLEAMVSEVHLDLSRLTLDEAGDAERIVNHEILLVIQDLGAALDLNSMAEAASKVDFSKMRAALGKREQLSRQLQTELRQQVADIQAQMNDLQQEIDAELARYDSMSNEAATRKDESFSTPLDERWSVLEEAAAMSRNADTHQVKAANLETNLGLIRPELVTVQTRIAQTETELISYKASKENLTKREAAAAQTAAARRADLSGENGMINKIKNELDIIYGNMKLENSGNSADASVSYKDVELKFDEAIAEAETAVSKANGSRKSPGGELRLIGAYQAQGTAQWRKAMFLKSVAQLVMRMADEADLLGRGEVDRALNQTIQADIAGAIIAAGETFTKATEAADRISSRNIDDRTKHRLVSNLNDTVVAITGQGVVEVAPMEEKREELPVFTEETTVGGDDPGGLIRQIIAMQNEGKFTKLFELIYTDTPTETKMMNLSRDSLSSIESLNAVCVSKLGVPLVDADHSINSILTSGMPGGAVAMAGASGSGLPTDALAKLTGDEVSNLEFGYDAGKTTAWITNNPDLSQINFVKVDGDWKVDVNLPVLDEANIQKVLDTIQSLTSATNSGINQVENEVKDGTLTDIDEVRTAVGKAMMKAMQEMMKNMQPQNMPSGGKGGTGGN